MQLGSLCNPLSVGKTKQNKTQADYKDDDGNKIKIWQIQEYEKMLENKAEEMFVLCEDNWLKSHKTKHHTKNASPSP
jgi:hypothetical protein